MKSSLVQQLWWESEAVVVYLYLPRKTGGESDYNIIYEYDENSERENIMKEEKNGERKGL